MSDSQAMQPPTAGNPTRPVLSLDARSFWALVAGGALAFTLVATKGYDLGRTFEQGLANVKAAELKAASEQAQTRLVSAQEKNAQLSESNAKLSQANGQLLELLKERNEQIERLAAQVGSVRNCAFLQSQIRTLEQEGSQIGQVALFSGPEPEERQQARRTDLTRRIEAYAAQLGSCK